ncbi:pentapeptide repeat protein [Geobacter metallireducens GS-15]|uniref:Pentapeptide repeat protein n=1 Tax=Geobacter metallireducens (strain ATCC 53774 / DSM 7210 / GS-15) TaxID=269799 RepID=Q39UJ4_GEOMG|nr:pentapeptide repeat protein [Geobacter metallireducens GS-15]
MGAQLIISPMTFDAAASCTGLNLVDMGNGRYRVVALGLINVGAIDFTLTYDKASLSSPKVVSGDLATWLVFVPNVVETSGTVQVVMVNEPPVSGSGTVATVTFSPVSKSWGKPALTCQLTGLDASNQPIESPLTSEDGKDDTGLSSGTGGSTNTGSTDTGSTDTGSTNTGSTNTGSTNTGSTNTGSTNTGSTNTGSTNTGSTNTGSTNTGSTNTGSTDTGSTDTGSTSTENYPDKSSSDTGPADKGSSGRVSSGLAPSVTSSVDKGSVDKGSVDKGSADKGSADKSSADKSSADTQGSRIPFVAQGTIILPDAPQSPLEPTSPDAQEPALGDQPAQWQPSPEAADREDKEHQPPTAPISPHTVPTTSVQEQKYAVFKGVLERFKGYSGDRTPKALRALFDEPVATSIKQDPAICITDGKMMIKVLLELPESGSNAPNFALRGARLTSLQKQGDNRWLIEAVPEAGKIEATLTIVNGEKIVDYPLTVAPRVDVDVDKNGVTDEGDFSLFLSKNGAAKVPAYDLNGDGKHDYIDDYIYTANYLTAGGGKKNKK